MTLGSEKTFVINELATGCCSHRPLHIEFSQVVDLKKKKPTEFGWLFCCLVDIWSELGRALSYSVPKSVGLVAIMSRKGIGSVDNLGGFRILDAILGTIEAGERFDMTAEEVIAYCSAE